MIGTQPTFIDLYAGCGGSALGFIEGGLKCIAAVEQSPEAVSSFWVNLCYQGWSSLLLDPEDTKAQKKIMDWTKGGKTNNTFFYPPANDWLYDSEPSPCLKLFCYDMMKLESEHIMEVCDFPPGWLDCIIGGPPCQGFSFANSNRTLDDPRNQLVFRFWDYAKVIQPKTVVMENVPGMLSLGKKKGEAEGPYPKLIKKYAEDCGYQVSYDIHDAKNYGVPQTRRRVFFYGIRNDLYEAGAHIEMPEITHDHNYFKEQGNEQMELFEEDKKEPYVTVFEAIGDLSNIPLSGTNDKNSREAELGTLDRIGNEAGKSSHYEHGNMIYGHDKWNGLWFPVQEVDERLRNDENGKEHRKCIHCGKYNIKVRTICHYCKQPVMFHSPNIV